MKRKTSLISAPPEPLTTSFEEIVTLIQQSRQRAFQVVNTELIDLYWRVGEYISRKLASAAWGEGVVEQLARYIAQKHPDLKGFNRPNLFRMRQFYETYRDDEKVSPLVRQLSWTHNITILSRSKRPEEREFYLRLATREKWSKRELERQFRGALFERAVLNPPKASAALKQVHAEVETIFKDSYLFDFLALPARHSEADLQRSLVANLRCFLVELGRDFCLVGEQYLVQVGKKDFRLDLLMYHRELQCLVDFELKIDDFKPEYLGQLEFYLEALDRDVRKPHERPSIGVLLCAGKDDEVVEYALSRSLSPALIAEYQLQLPDKKLLQAKLREFYELATAELTAETPKANVATARRRK
ncbi:MAG TPA: PDDEXK nuclease domain-containing protein [Blastocatellia bacterium]|nr:PDDEXK nuclease domain-containing protein [Blastocatellia bacterium]